jgi:hypothetical protein
MSTKDSKQAQSNESLASPPPSSLPPSPLADEAPAATKCVLSYFGGITTDEGAPRTTDRISGRYFQISRRLELRLAACGLRQVAVAGPTSPCPSGFSP